METNMKQQQVTKRTGQAIHPTLDELTLCHLAEIQQTHRNRGNHFSHSIIVRRAIRLYNAYIKKLTDYEREVIEAKRAAAGVL